MDFDDKIEDHIFEEFSDKDLVRDVDDKNIMFNDQMDDKFEHERGKEEDGEGDKKEPVYESEKKFSLENLTDKDIERLVNYNEEKRKTESFGYNFTQNVSGGDYSPNDYENKFKDYLKAPKISGSSKLRGNSLIIDSDKVIESGKTVEIADNPIKHKGEHENSSVIINRDEKGEIENIQIVCKCGEKLLLKFDYTENDLSELTEAKNDKVQRNIWSSDELLTEGQKRNFQDDVFKEAIRETEEEKLIKEMEVERLVKEYEDFGMEKLLGLDENDSSKQIAGSSEKGEQKDDKEEDDFFQEDLDFFDNDGDEDFGDIDFSNI